MKNFAISPIQNVTLGYIRQAYIYIYIYIYTPPRVTNCPQRISNVGHE